jgi:aspartate/methionine/tyrosine aminotransferase
MPTIDQVVQKYLELRDKKKILEEKAKAFKQEVDVDLGKIEAWLLAKMNADGVDSYKTEHGTPYKSVTISVKSEDPEEFREFIMEDAVVTISQYLESSFGVGGTPVRDFIRNALLQHGRWDMVDFRPLKKGIQDFIEQERYTPPGVDVEQRINVNVRRG